MTTSERFLAARKHLNKSQRAMAELVGCSFGTWQKYEQTDSLPGGDIMSSLVALGFSSDWLLAGLGSMLISDTVSASPLDESLLEAVVLAIEEHLDEVKGRLSPSKKAQLIGALYDMFADSVGKQVDQAAVIRLVKLAA